MGLHAGEKVKDKAKRKAANAKGAAKAALQAEAKVQEDKSGEKKDKLKTKQIQDEVQAALNKLHHLKSKLPKSKQAAANVKGKSEQAEDSETKAKAGAKDKAGLDKKEAEASDK